MISIIVVGYKSKKDLKECFDSIQNSTYKKYRIIFVDNDSNDGSIEYVKKFYPKIITIKNQNTGYAGGNNVGIEKAVELGSNYIFLLNPDTILDKECLSSLAREASPKLILQPIILIFENKRKTNLINTTGNHLNFLGISYCSDYRRNSDQASDASIAGASGAALFADSQMFQEVGLLDQNFFMYHEDLDLSWRARREGYDIKLSTAAKVWHKYSFSKNKSKFFYVERNRLLFLFKNFSVKYLLLIFPAFVLNEILMLLYSLFTGWLMFKIRSYGSAIALIFTGKVCRIVRDQSFVPEAKLKKYIDSQVSFSEVDSKLFAPYNLFLKIYFSIIYKFI